jgi:hypothetical protein
MRMRRLTWLLAPLFVVAFASIAPPQAEAACYVCDNPDSHMCTTLLQGNGKTQCQNSPPGQMCDRSGGTNCSAAGGDCGCWNCCPFDPSARVVPNGEPALRWARGEERVDAPQLRRMTPPGVCNVPI